MESIFARIKNNVLDDALVTLIANQIGKLSSADQELANLIKSPPSGLTDLVDVLDEFSVPDIDRSGIIGQGISSLRDLIPTDPSDLTGGLTEALDQFFADLNSNLTDQLSKILDSFRAIHELTQIDFSFGENTSSENPAIRQGLRGTVGAMLAGENKNDELDEAFDSVKDFLALLPDPLTVVSLLEWMLEILQALPRHLYPLRYMPLSDELKDKLETTTFWREMNGSQLSSQLTASLDKLATSIHTILIADGMQPVADQLDALSSHINRDTLMDALDSLIEGLATLAQKVRDGDLTAATATVSELNSSLGQLQPSLTAIETSLLEGQIDDLNHELAKLDDKMNGRILQLFSNLNPPSDLASIAVLVEPLNDLLDEIGFNTVISTIREFFSAITKVLNQLNLTAVKDAFQNVIDDAVAAVDDLNDILIAATVNFSVMIDRVEDAIDDLQIDQIVTEMENGLNNFRKLAEDGVNTVFEPIRTTLLTAFSSMNNFIGDFDPAIVIGELQNLIRQLTDILSDPQLLDVIDTLQQALNRVNEELEEFSFKPVTDTVVDAIEVVEDGLKIAASIPLTDSLKSDLSDALGVLPSTIRPATQSIHRTFEDIVDEGPKPVLSEIKEKPAELVELVGRYSPDQYIGDKLSKPYDEVLKRMQSFRPDELFKPVQETLDRLIAELNQIANPARFLQPLEKPFNDLLQLLDEFNPQSLIQPLQEQLQAGIQFTIDHLPLEETDTIFDQIEAITNQISDAVDVVVAWRDLFKEIKNRGAGLADPEAQINNLSNEIAAKIDEVADIADVLAAIQQVENALNSIKASPLLQVLEPSLDAVIAKLIDIQPKARLVNLIAAHRGFPRAALEALPASAEKTAILSLLDSFDPMDESFTVPLNALDTWRSALQSANTDIADFFSNWDDRYHGAQSPLNELRRSDLTVTELKTLLTETIQQQLTDSIAPLFKVVNHGQNLLDALLAEVTALLDDLLVMVSDLFSIADALETLREAINQLVQALEDFDISFIADEIQSLFDALAAKLETLRPNRIAAIVGETFDDLLDLLNVNALLGADQLNLEYQRLVDTLKNIDPKTLVTDLVQPEYDKILAFLAKLDLSEPIDSFLERLNSLQQELETELERTAGAYDDLIGAIPSDLRGELAAAVNVGGAG